MKTLYLCRHAESDFGTGLLDFERSLNERGLLDAARMGKHIAVIEAPPEYIISSPALRAVSTLEAMLQYFSISKENIQTEKRLYEARVLDLFDIVCNVEDKVDSLMLLGHNPSFTEFLNALTLAGVENMPTCGLATIRFNIDLWSHLKMGKGKLLRLDTPKNLWDKTKE